MSIKYIRPADFNWLCSNDRAFFLTVVQTADEIKSSSRVLVALNSPCSEMRTFYDILISVFPQPYLEGDEKEIGRQFGANQDFVRVASLHGEFPAYRANLDSLKDSLTKHLKPKNSS